MDQNEVRQLRSYSEGRAMLDLSRGRKRGVLAWMLVDMALQTGLRASELSKLTTKDIDLRLKLLNVTRSKKKKPTTTTIPLSPSLISHLRAYLEWRERLDIQSNHLFFGQRGRLTAAGLSQIFKATAKRAGMRESLSIHCCRHTCGMFAYRKTKDLRLVQTLLGHSSPTITAGFYVETTFEDLADAVEGLYE